MLEQATQPLQVVLHHLPDLAIVQGLLEHPVGIAQALPLGDFPHLPLLHLDIVHLALPPVVLFPSQPATATLPVVAATLSLLLLLAPLTTLGLLLHPEDFLPLPLLAPDTVLEEAPLEAAPSHLDLPPPLLTLVPTLAVSP